MILHSLLSSACGFGGAELYFPTYPTLQTSTSTSYQTHLTLISFASHHSYQKHHCICSFLTWFLTLLSPTFLLYIWKKRSSENPQWLYGHPGCMGGQPWWANQPQSMASRSLKLSKTHQMTTRTLTVKSRKREGHRGTESSHRSPKCSSRERDRVWWHQGVSVMMWLERRGDEEWGCSSALSRQCWRMWKWVPCMHRTDQERKVETILERWQLRVFWCIKGSSKERNAVLKGQIYGSFFCKESSQLS